VTNIVIYKLVIYQIFKSKTAFAYFAGPLFK